MDTRAGIYCILNLKNHKRYIGSATDVRRRIYKHQWLLRGGKHESPLLQGAWDRDGEASFVFTVIEFCAKEDILKREQLWINALKVTSRKFGYNVCPVAGSRAGVPQPKGHAEQIRAIHKGKPKTPEHREKIRQASLNRWRDQSQREQQAARFTGKSRRDCRKLTDEQAHQLRADRASGLTFVDLQKKYGIGASAAHKIIHGVNYRTPC